MKIEIKSRFSAAILFTATIADTTPSHLQMKEAVKAALSASANLTSANLTSANLRGANLRGANLTSANLTSADLRGADLRSANLRGADLRGADLTSADLTSANLTSANLRGANLRGADLTSANLRGADLTSANLRGADLTSANLTSANLTSADLRGANLRGADLTSADLTSADLTDARKPAFQIPREGELIVYKKVRGGVCKIRIPPDAKRTISLVGRKCRAEWVEVLEAPADGRGLHDSSVVYVAGQTVRPDKYDDDVRVECTHGIHFFLTKEEAEDYC